jgi:hypothetical protein
MIEVLGEGDLLLPGLVADALGVNDRVKRGCSLARRAVGAGHQGQIQSAP